MGNLERLVIGLLILFALVVVVVFRRRWQGAIGWLLIAGTFIVSVVNRNTATLVFSSIAALVIVVGIGLAGYDYLRFERPRRRQRRAEREAMPPTVRVHRRRPSLLRRRSHHREEHP
ncbi:MAG: hypothetical protein H0T53_08980 [Herpetosiphonaceae bacterium]|nr:hypothetical protein [Herpetosiphonaceae bacterium]